MITHNHSLQTRKRVSLSAVLIGFVGLSLLLTLTIAIISSTQTQKQSLMNNTLELNYSTAVQMSQTMDSLFESMQSSLSYAADTIGQSGGSIRDDELEFRLELVRNSSSYFNSLMVADQTGLVRSVSPKSIGTAGSYITSEEGLTALKSREPFISEVYTTPKTKRRIILVSEPIFDRNGEYRGLIGGTVYLQDKNILNQIFGSQIKKDGTSYFYIVDSKGHLLYHPDKARIGMDISAVSVVQQLMKNHEGKGQYINLSGVDLLAGYAKIPSTNWGLVVVSPTQIIYDQLYRHVKLLLLYTSLPLLVLILIVVWAAHQLAKPFVVLANLVQQFEEGGVELPERREHWNREADLLTRTVVGALRNFQRQNDQLSQEAKTDMLTGLSNRRTFEDTIQSWADQHIAFAILVLDIDRFKIINDTYGHQAGDLVLRQVAAIIREEVAPQDLSTRFGGEEFVVLLQGADGDEAYLKAEQIRLAVERASMPVEHTVTVSIGIAIYPLHASVPTELFHLADNALYRAKAEGRNRTVLIQALDLPGQ
ncbi:putative diguanylate cyclase YcdT [compost metagenome]